MSNRTAGVIITIIAVLLCGCPGLAALCWGLLSLIDYAGGLGITGIGDQNGFLGSIFGGVCGGIVLIAIAVVVSFFVLRKKKVTPLTSTNEPIPPASPNVPLPPESHEEPLPPTNTGEPVPPTSPEETIPPPQSPDEPLPPAN